MCYFFYRHSSDSSYAFDKYRNSSAKNSYRNNYKEENKYENWRSNMAPLSREKSDSKRNKDDKYSLRSKHEKSPTKDNKELENGNYYFIINDLFTVFYYFSEVDDISQRDRLIEQVNKGTLECLVCCEFVRQVDKTWACQKCYHIFHLRCSLKWAKTSKDGKYFFI